MGDRGAGGGADQAGDPGVAEQVQDARRFRLGADGGVQPGPVGRLLGEEAQVAERGEAAEEGENAREIGLSFFARWSRALRT